MPRNNNSDIGNRKFGVEIEFIGISISKGLQALENAGLSVNRSLSGSYNHRDSHHDWKIVTDSSIQGRGGECVSPILSGEEGLGQVEKACRALVRAGATVNRSCGLHVHVDARDLTAADIASTFFRYAECESTIDIFMPRSRRREENSYCQSLRRFAGARLVDSSSPVGWRLRGRGSLENVSPREMVRLLQSDRFCKLNLCSFINHGSIEFRHHSGTVNSEKVTNWIRFCVNFVEQSRYPTSPRSPRARGARRQRPVRNSKQLRKLHKIISCLRGNIHDLHDLSEATGLSEASVSVYISKLRTVYGFDIRKNRYLNRYYITRLGQLPSIDDVPAVADSVSATEPAQSVLAFARSLNNPFLGLPTWVTNYYNERSMELAG